MIDYNLRMSNILKFFRRIHHNTPAFSKEDLNDDRDAQTPVKVLQKNHRFLRQSSVDTDYKQTSSSPNNDKKVKYKIHRNLLDPSNTSPSHQEFKNSFRAKLFISPNINRFKRFHSLNNENVEEIESNTASVDNNNFNTGNLVFERVKVKQNTRYLRHSPDRSSLESVSSVDTPTRRSDGKQSNGIDYTMTHISNGNNFDRHDVTSTNNNEIDAPHWASNNAAAMHLWGDNNKNSVDDINNNNWDDDFEITLRSSVSPLPSSISSSSTMDTWVDDESVSLSISANDWVDDTDGFN